jgi:hypothetical protein
MAAEPAAWASWRRSCPFWGGLWIILAGLVRLLDSVLTAGQQDGDGSGAVLPYLPAPVLLICGLLAITVPRTRLLAVIGAVAGAVSVIGLGFPGGWDAAALGILGATLTVMWTPAPAAEATTAPQVTTVPRPPVP